MHACHVEAGLAVKQSKWKQKQRETTMTTTQVRVVIIWRPERAVEKEYPSAVAPKSVQGGEGRR